MVERGVPCYRRKPRAKAALLAVKLSNLFPHAHRDLGKAVLPVLRILQDRRNDVSHERPIMEQQRVHALFVFLKQQPLDRVLLHITASFRAVCLSHYTRRGRKSHAYFLSAKNGRSLERPFSGFILYSQTSSPSRTSTLMTWPAGISPARIARAMSVSTVL